MKEIPPTVVADLIRLGGVGEIDAALGRELVTRLGPFDCVDRLDWQSWDAVTAKLIQHDLACLARGLVRAEKIERWGGGSVAGAIWVFRMFQHRFSQDANALAEWMLINSDNPWIPFGSNRGDAHSLVELESYHEAKAARRRASADDTDLKQHLRQVREAVRHRLAAERRAVQSVAVSARQQLLDTLRPLSLRERIEHVAWDDFHPLAFYPADLVEGSFQHICAVDAVSLRRLLSKAVPQPRGPWRTWVRGLRRACADNPPIAAAHGLEALCAIEPPKTKSNKATKP